MITCILVVLLIEPWIVSLIHCEILTAKYSCNDLIAACEESGMVGEITTLKILEIEPALCKVYVKNDSGGHVMVLERGAASIEKPWRQAYWWTIWSEKGSADGFVWPYIR